MADQTSGDRPVDFTSGPIEGQHHSKTRVSDRALPEAALDRDLTGVDADQLVADRDRAVRDRDPALGADAAVREFSRDIRRRAARQRENTARARLDAAAERDRIANARDLAALARDQAAAARDLAMAQRDFADEQYAGVRAITGAEIVMRAAAERRRAAERRAQAAAHHALAAQDRLAAAQDREQAAREREQALADRESLARQPVVVATDALTGARPRAAGLVDLDHELQRCSRTSGLLVIALVDVVSSTTPDDSQNQVADDEVLVRVATLIHEHLRAYDLIIRLGASEFLCAMSSMTLPVARDRFAKIATALAAAAPGSGTIAAGFAVLTSHESAPELIARADSDLFATRRMNSTTSTIDSSPPAP